jgi:hypothetical protein
MAGRKVLVLEMRVRHLPPEPQERRYLMASTTLRLVIDGGEPSAEPGAGKRSEPEVTEHAPGVSAMNRIGIQVDIPPDDAA